MKAFDPAAKAKRHSHSLKRKTWQFFLILLSLFCVVIISSYSIIMSRAAVDSEVTGSEMALISIDRNLEISLDRYNDMSRQIMLNTVVMEYLRDQKTGNSHNATEVRDAINSVTNIYSFVDSVYVYRNDGRHVRTGAGVMEVNRIYMTSPEWYMPLIEAKGGNVVMINGNGAFIKKIGIPLITMARLIYDIDTQQVIGLLVVNLTAGVLNSSIRDLSEQDRLICFLDQDGNVLWGDENLQGYFKKQYIGKGFSWEEVALNSQKYILSAYSSNDIPVVQLSIHKISGTGLLSREGIWIAITLISAVVLSVFSSGAFISSNIARPIDELTEAIDETKSNGMLHELNLTLPNNEIRRLADSYNSMIRHINQLIRQLIEKEKSVQKAEIRILHEQIKPHFLYNSLETISYMALQSDAPKVHDALETLGSFYRNFLSKGSREIPLRNEVMIVKDYLALQKLRYGDTFDDEYDLDERVLDTKIPKLILQPLVENSLYHGVRLKGEKGLIRISAFEQDGQVHISVFDTGVGMTQEQIEEVLSSNGPDYETALSGFGLKGTIERIRYYCNRREVIEIKSEPGEFTQIEIIMPKEEKRGDVNV